MPQFGAKLTDDSRVVIYDCNMFIMEATEEASERGRKFEKLKTLEKIEVIEGPTTLNIMAFSLTAFRTTIKT
jgi:hypothetical protein